MKRIAHKLIQWYLRRCGGVFHTNPYGPSGRYVVLMDEDQYHRFRQSQPLYQQGFTSAELEVLLREDITPCTVNADGSVTW
jgi:hypothetical protein